MAKKAKLKNAAPVKPIECRCPGRARSHPSPRCPRFWPWRPIPPVFSDASDGGLRPSCRHACALPLLQPAFTRAARRLSSVAVFPTREPRQDLDVSFPIPPRRNRQIGYERALRQIDCGLPGRRFSRSGRRRPFLSNRRAIRGLARTALDHLPPSWLGKASKWIPSVET